MNTRFAATLFLGAALSLFAADSTPVAKSAWGIIEDVLRQPGAFDQMCTINHWGAFPAYGVARRGRWITPENFQKLRSERASVVAELVRLLKQYRPEPLRMHSIGTLLVAPVPMVVVGEGHVTSPALAPRNPDLLMMLVDLNAVEGLEELLRLESSIHAQSIKLASAAAGSPNSSELFSTVSYHRDLLGVIAAILRQEKYPLLLESEVELEFRRTLEKRAKAEGFSAASVELPLTPNQRRYVSLDPIYRLPSSPNQPVQIEYTETLRDRIVAFGKSFLKSVPTEKRLAARGMIPEPVTR